MRHWRRWSCLGIDAGRRSRIGGQVHYANDLGLGNGGNRFFGSTLDTILFIWYDAFVFQLVRRNLIVGSQSGQLSIVITAQRTHCFIRHCSLRDSNRQVIHRSAFAVLLGNLWTKAKRWLKQSTRGKTYLGLRLFRSDFCRTRRLFGCLG
jgi:hypothetical protein